MSTGSGTSLEDKVAKLGKEVLWLRIAVILALVVLALVAVAVLQLRTPVSELAAAQAAPATVTVKAARFVVLDGKGVVRGELGVKDNAAGIELFDAAGKSVWKTPTFAAPAPETGTKEVEKGKEK